MNDALVRILENAEELSNDEILALLDSGRDKQEVQLKIFWGTIRFASTIFNRCGCDLEENLSYAWEALKNTCEKYQDVGCKFVTYYGWWLRSYTHIINNRKHTKSNRLNTISIDDEHDGINWHDVVASQDASLPFEIHPIDAQISIVNEVAGKVLTRRQKEVWDRYVFHGYRQLPIANEMGLSKQAISICLKRCFSKIKAHIEREMA